MMEAAESRDIFLSCFKCGRIVRSSDAECPRCGLQFGPGTLFECPFCSGLIWRNATKCASCGIDLTEFSESVMRTSSGFDMDNFVDGIINNELDQLKSTIRRVACPGCGLMIRGDEDKCPRCDLPLEEAKVDCPVCGERISISAKSCDSCQAVFEELPEAEESLAAEEPQAVVHAEAESAPDEGPEAEEPPARAPPAPVRKAAPPKRPVQRPKVAKRPAAKPAPKRAPAKKAPPKKAPAKKAVAKRPAAKKAPARRPAKAKPAKRAPPKASKPKKRKR